MLIAYDTVAAPVIYKLMSQSVIPRPIAWVVTEQNGVVNVAPFSYFTGLSSNPPTMLFSVGHKSDGTPKDTLRNLRETKKCTVCIASDAQLEPLHFSSKELGAEVSEAEHFAIAYTRPVPGYPPMIEGVPVAFFCDFYSEVDLGESRTIPLIVQIKAQFIDDTCITDPQKPAIDFAPIARIGKSYASLGEEHTPPVIP